MTDKQAINALVLDDDEADIISLSRQLSKLETYDVKVFSAENSEAAMAVCGYEDIDVIFSDYALKEGSSVSFIESVSGLKSKVPIVLVSGMPGRAVRREAFPAGARAFLSKDDLSPDQIEAAIETAQYSLEIETAFKKQISAYEVDRAQNQDLLHNLCSIVDEFIRTLDANPKVVPEQLSADMRDILDMITSSQKAKLASIQEIGNAGALSGSQAEMEQVSKVFHNMCTYFFQDASASGEIVMTQQYENGLFSCHAALQAGIDGTDHSEGLKTITETAKKLGGSVEVSHDLSGTILTLIIPVKDA